MVLNCHHTSKIFCPDSACWVIWSKAVLHFGQSTKVECADVSLGFNGHKVWLIWECWEFVCVVDLFCTHLFLLFLWPSGQVSVAPLWTVNLALQNCPVEVSLLLMFLVPILHNQNLLFCDLWYRIHHTEGMIFKLTPSVIYFSERSECS
jgi:hypothetical protein